MKFSRNVLYYAVSLVRLDSNWWSRVCSSFGSAWIWVEGDRVPSHFSRWAQTNSISDPES